MPPLLEIVLSNAVMASLLAVVAGAVTYFVRRPALAHGLWLLVLLKLVTPPIIPLQFSWPATANPLESSDSQASIQSMDSSDRWQPIMPSAESGPVTTIVIIPVEAESPAANLPSAVVETATLLENNFWTRLSEKTSALWPSFLAPLWLTGSALWLGWTLFHVYRFQRLLRHAQPAPPSLQDEVRQWADQLGLRKCPRLWLVPGCVSPMLWTLGPAARLLFPAKLLERLDNEQRSALLIHELAHFRRRDHWVRWLEMAVMAVYWWHPVVWWARRELHEAEEQCCDAWVVWALASRDEPSRVSGRAGESDDVSAHRRAYALALLNTVDFFSHARPTLPAPASGVGQVPHLRRRLTMIMNANTPRSLSIAGRLAVLSLGLLLPLVPVQAQSGPQDPKDDRDQQIEKLKKVIQALEQQKRAEQEQNVADQRIIELRRATEEKARHLERATKEERERAEHVQREADVAKMRLAEELDQLKKVQARQHAQAEEQRAKAEFAFQEAQLAQNRESEPRRREREIIQLNIDNKASPELQNMMRSIEEITRAIEVKRQELRGMEEKLQHARVQLEKWRAERAVKESRRMELRSADGAPGKEPIILRIDPSANPEQIMKQVEEIKARVKDPIRVEIRRDGKAEVTKEPIRGEIRLRVDDNKETRPALEVPARIRAREARDPRGGDLEQKLERIMKEVEELRRELRDSNREPRRN
jgi:beta-lactamase regulating signal transducer with metallopeptidase domain